MTDALTLVGFITLLNTREGFMLEKLFSYAAVFGTMLVVVTLYGKIYYISTNDCKLDLTRCEGLIDASADTKAPLRDSESSFYFSVVTWTTLGYGDIIPSKNLRTLTLTEVVTGWISMAISIGVLLNLLNLATGASVSQHQTSQHQTKKAQES